MTAATQLRLVPPLRVENPVSIKFMLDDLAKSGLLPEDMRAYPVAPIAFGTCGGWLIPYPGDEFMHRIRYNRQEDKYIQPAGMRDVWWPWQLDLAYAREQDVIYIIEGEKKAAAFYKRFKKFAFGIGGCASALESIKGNMRKVLLPNLVKGIKPGCMVVAIFDGDIETNDNIQTAALELKAALQSFHCSFKICRPPEGKGVDDWLVANPQAALFELVEVTDEQLAASRKMLYRNLELTLNEEGRPHQNEINITKLLTNFWSKRVINERRLGLIRDRERIDYGMLEYESVEYIQQRHFQHAPAHLVDRALRYAVMSLKRDLVQEMVAGLGKQWDGVHRLDTWGSKHFPTNTPALANEWGRLFVTAVVLRVLYPGCQVDTAFFLVGEQGLYKTTFFEDFATLDGNSDFYVSLSKFSSDQNDNNRTEGMRIKKAILVDINEGAAFKGHDKEELIKSKITQKFDTYRVPYAKDVEILKRGFVFVGSSNKNEFLNDVTGSRRYLPLRVIDKVMKLGYEEKLQLFAEVSRQAEELIKTNWWELRIKLEDIPVQEEHKHITSVQERLAIPFQRERPFEEAVLELIRSHHFPRLQGGYFLWPNYLHQTLGAEFGMTRRTITWGIDELKDSVSFPYKVRPHRPRKPQLDFKDNPRVAEMYIVGNDQQMFTGYHLIPKDY